jgi:hypothetical protein
MFYTQNHKDYVVESMFFSHHKEYDPRSTNIEKVIFFGFCKKIICLLTLFVKKMSPSENLVHRKVT